MKNKIKEILKGIKNTKSKDEKFNLCFELDELRKEDENLFRKEFVEIEDIEYENTYHEILRIIDSKEWKEYRDNRK